jgi:glycosyltransferase involved in cell wall biosynthesis
MAGWPDPFFLAVGRQIPAKNFLFLLEVYEMYRVAAGLRALPLVLVGEGPQRKMIERFISDRQLQQVHLSPFVSPEKLRAFYHHAAALVLPSTSETWGLVVNEAMAAGLPVLVSKTCGCASELVKEDTNGYTFYPDRPDQLLTALLLFTNKDAMAREAMKKASQRIIQPWGLDRFVKGSLQALDYAVANKKTCRSLQARWVLRRWKGRYRPV